MVPYEPTAVHVQALTNETECSSLSLRLYCGTQVAPPSAVRRMIPPSPTMVPTFASKKETANTSADHGAAFATAKETP